MGHNPLAEELQEKSRQLGKLQRRRAALIAELDWHRDFDREMTAQEVRIAQETCATLEVARAEATRSLVAAEREYEDYRRKSKLGINIVRWFSTERRAAKGHRRTLARDAFEFKERESRLEDEVAEIQMTLRSARKDLDRFDNLSVEATESAIADLDASIPLCQLARDELAARKQELDRRLKEPLKVLTDLQEEERRVRRDRSLLISRVEELERDIRRASRLDRSLSEASNAYERAMIHKECAEEFGHGSPRVIMSDHRKEMSEVKRKVSADDRLLEGIQRNIKKAERRIEEVISRGTRDVRALVIDGSNLCYQDDTFIRLAALRPLCDRLKDKYDVTVVFDASIRYKLGGCTDRALREALPGVNVHVVATRTKADETILAVAEDPYIFVLSNDRFSEYREKSVVREGRLIRHEIVNGQVLVHELEIAVPFAAKG